MGSELAARAHCRSLLKSTAGLGFRMSPLRLTGDDGWRLKVLLRLMVGVGSEGAGKGDFTVWLALTGSEEHRRQADGSSS